MRGGKVAVRSMLLTLLVWQEVWLQQGGVAGSVALQEALIANENHGRLITNKKAGRSIADKKAGSLLHVATPVDTPNYDDEADYYGGINRKTSSRKTSSRNKRTTSSQKKRSRLSQAFSTVSSAEDLSSFSSSSAKGTGSEALSSSSQALSSASQLSSRSLLQGSSSQALKIKDTPTAACPSNEYKVISAHPTGTCKPVTSCKAGAEFLKKDAVVCQTRTTGGAVWYYNLWIITVYFNNKE